MARLTFLRRNANSLSWHLLVIISRGIGRALLALLVTAAFTALLITLRDSLSTTTVALMYLLPVVLSTALWGLGAGIAAAILAFLAYNYYFLTPYYTMQVHSSQDIVAMAVFLAVAILISQLIGRARAGEAEASDRERETNRLYELNSALASSSHPKDIARILAVHSQETLQAACAIVALAKIAGSASITAQASESAQAPGGVPPPDTHPQAIFPLQSARGLFGELRLWRQKPLNPAEERLIRAFAVQSVLALERANLVQAESRALVLEESDRLKSSLLSSVSHDLRTPLATIKASVTSLLSGDVGWDTEARLDLLAAIDEETDHLNQLVGNLLAMSRIESGALHLNRQWNQLSEIVNSVLARLRRALEYHQVRVDVPDDLPLVPVDYVQIQQVFTNLISNSTKYAPSGTVIDITARVTRDGSAILIQVINEGPLVADEHLERIFEKFYRVTDAERITGTGLGLSICKGLILAHGGQIWAKNLPGHFAFNFTLPLAWDGLAPPVVQSELL